MLSTKMKTLLVATLVAVGLQVVPSVSKADTVVITTSGGSETYQCNNLLTAANYCDGKSPKLIIEVPAERDYYPYWLPTSFSCGDLIAAYQSSACPQTH